MRELRLAAWGYRLKIIRPSVGCSGRIYGNSEPPVYILRRGRGCRNSSWDTDVYIVWRASQSLTYAARAICECSRSKFLLTHRDRSAARAGHLIPIDCNADREITGISNR